MVFSLMLGYYTKAFRLATKAVPPRIPLEKTMAKLSTEARKKLPAGKFAGPNKSYPIPDKSHAGNAKARVAQQVNAGKATPALKAKVDAAANKVLGKGMVKKGGSK
jgi:hypothetical protein